MRSEGFSHRLPVEIEECVLRAPLLLGCHLRLELGLPLLLAASAGFMGCLRTMDNTWEHGLAGVRLK
jgi:hypothetical protein